MRILCLNTWGGRLHDRLLPFLAGSGADILCLQEVVHSPATGKDWLTYRDGDHVLPQRANLFADLRAALPDHDGQFCPAAQGQLWDGKDPVASAWGLATFVRRSLPVIGQVQGFVHKDYSPSGFGDHPRSRNAHGVRVFDPAANRAVSVIHMHGLRDLRGKADTPDRRAQAERFLAMLGQLASPEDAVVACGDFNVEPDSETLRLLAGAGLTDLVTASGPVGTRTSLYPRPGRFADYLLVNAPARPARFEIIRSPEVSDHCPLILDLAAQGGGP